MTTDTERWRVERQCGPAGQLHDRSASLTGGDEGSERLARILRVDRAAVVLGSSQPDTDVDGRAAAAAGVDVVRRRSGGGAVLVDPDSVVWVDLIVPAGDPLWDADIGRAGWWVGDAWAAALEAVGAGSGQVWRGGMLSTPWSSRVCFAGLGPGEVRIDGQKVVGVSQRRTRRATLFQTVALLSWDPARLLELLRLDDSERAQAVVDISPLAMGIGPARAGGLVAALLDVLSARLDC